MTFFEPHFRDYTVKFLSNKFQTLNIHIIKDLFFFQILKGEFN